ncbi:MAG TPA: hypothetical protein VHE13_07155 [Opitutus sp.]|nr:hypothetical protein [Opitutus sp.]
MFTLTKPIAALIGVLGKSVTQTCRFGKKEAAARLRAAAQSTKERFVKSTDTKSIATTWEGRGDRARHIIREYRGLLSGYAAVPEGEDQPRPARASAKTKTKTKAASASDLPAEMRQAFERYKRKYPGAVQLVAYITAGGSDPARSISRFAEPPPDDEIVILSLIETVASARGVEARSQVLLLRRIEKR